MGGQFYSEIQGKAVAPLSAEDMGTDTYKSLYTVYCGHCNENLMAVSFQTYVGRRSNQRELIQTEITGPFLQSG